jgi:hypothetical protein
MISISIVCLLSWRLTLLFAEGQLVLVGPALWQPVDLVENVWMQLAELDRSRPDRLHPAFMANVLCDKGGPDGDGLARPTTS